MLGCGFTSNCSQPTLVLLSCDVTFNPSTSGQLQHFLSNPQAVPGLNAFGIPVSHLRVLALAQEKQRGTQLHLLAALLRESEPSRKLLSRMLFCVNSQVLETGSGGNMLIITRLLELVIKKSHLTMTMISSTLKIILSFKTTQISATFLMTTIAAHRQKQEGT